MTPKPVWILTGPTASGKSALGLWLAPRLDAEIVSLDSMQVFRGMDIGTAKPTAAEQAAVRHWLIDLVSPDAPFNVTRYLAAVDEALADIDRRGRTALFVGGTALYLQVLLRGLFDGPSPDPALRERLARRAAAGESLHDRLRRVDPVSAGRLHPKDLRRISRALEVHAATGRPLSALQRRTRPALRRPFRGIVLRHPRSVLHERIARRTEAMLAAGWVEEVRTILAGPGLGPQACQALGYREIADALSCGEPPERRFGQILSGTRRLARHQETWLRRFDDQLVPLDIAPGDPGDLTRSRLEVVVENLSKAAGNRTETGVWLR